MQPEWTCGSCGLVIRRERLRCPRCSELLEAPPPRIDAAKPATAERGGSGLVAIGVALLAVLGLGWYALLTRDAEPAVAATVQPATAGLRQPLERPASDDAGTTTDQDDPAAALAAAEAALADDPQDGDARRAAALSLLRLGRPADALPHLDRAIAADPAASLRFHRARAHAALERWPQAIADYEAAAEASPDDHATFYNLGLVYGRIEAHDKAAAAFERAVTLAPGEPGFLVPLATEYLALDRVAEARTVFEQYLHEQPAGTESSRVRQVLESLTPYATASR